MGEGLIRRGLMRESESDERPGAAAEHTLGEERLDKEAGQVGILIIGYLLVSLLVVTVVLGVSAVYIGHKQLLSAADGAALAAADNYTIAVDSADGAATPLPALQASGVEESASGYLTATGAGARFDHLAVDPATGALDGRTARVVLTAVVRPPIVNFLVPDGIPIVAESDARAELTR